MPVRFARNRRASTSPKVSPGSSRMPAAAAGTSDSTRTDSGGSTYARSRPSAAAPPSSERSTR